MPLYDQINMSTRAPERSRNVSMGVALAKVTDIKDPEKKNRVRCKLINNISGGEADMDLLNWAYVMAPFAGANSGICFMPNIDDVVLVAFDGGDIRRPYVIGGVWGSLQTPPATYKEGKNEEYIIKTPNDLSLQFHDKKSEESVTLKTPKGRSLSMDDKGKLVKLTDGNSFLSIDDNNGEVTLKCKSKLTINVGAAKIIIDGQAGNIQIQAQNNLEMKGTQIKMTANASAEVKANASLKLESSGVAEVKGGVLKLN